MSEKAMIALLPIVDNWCRMDLPHMTLVYAGNDDSFTASSFNELAKDASDLAQLSRNLYLRVTGVEIFGEGVDGDPFVDVFTLQPTPELLAMRRQVQGWNASQFPFRPHCTIGPTGNIIVDRPSHIAFNKIIATWGDENMTFNMRSENGGGAVDTPYGY